MGGLEGKDTLARATHFRITGTFLFRLKKEEEKPARLLQLGLYIFPLIQVRLAFDLHAGAMFSRHMVLQRAGRKHVYVEERRRAPTHALCIAVARGGERQSACERERAAVPVEFTMWSTKPAEAQAGFAFEIS